uniref:Small vasohibin-binding protein n=1 Tax=Panagrellus redivivus TaxID=6233 RepID=A0A7E4V9D6_PANRE
MSKVQNPKSTPRQDVSAGPAKENNNSKPPAKPIQKDTATAVKNTKHSNSLKEMWRQRIEHQAVIKEKMQHVRDHKRHSTTASPEPLPTVCPKLIDVVPVRPPPPETLRGRMAAK